MGTWSKSGTPAETMVGLPLRAYGPIDEDGDQAMKGWPLSSADLYNYKAQQPLFLDNSRGLINLFETDLSL